MREGVDFDEWRRFDDHPADDPAVGLARAADIKGRCVNCWGPAVGSKDGDRWIRIRCRLCGRSVNGEDAEQEAESMQLEAKSNMRRARGGRGLKYREDARFVLKILPDMNRDKAQFDQRVAARQAEKPKRGWMGRREFPPGTAGNLYAQACFFSSGLENLPREMSAIALSDFEFGQLQIVDVDVLAADASIRVDTVVPARHLKASGPALGARMGTTMVAGMVAAFACELGMKAILMTRLDEAKKTHDLLELYKALPKDSRERLEADFPGIAGGLEDHRHVFDKWRYFEERVNEDAIQALVHTDRVWELGKAVRVIIDECEVAGLTYEIHVNTTFNVTVDQRGLRNSEDIGLRLVVGEAAIPWDRVLPADLQAT